MKLLDLIMPYLVEIVASVLLISIGIFGTWLSAKIGKNKDLANIHVAKAELFNVTEQTVLELKQAFVDDWKASRKDGKLTEEEKNALGAMLLDIVKRKMSAPSMDILRAALVDLDVLIHGYGEAIIAQMQINKNG